jgi:molybdenum cofactor cytidylyltransferase
MFYNKNYKNGLGSSVSFILKKKINKNGIMFIPGDMPLISIKDFEKLIKTFVQKKNKIISPCYKKKIGNPLIIPKFYFNLLKNLKKDEGARKFLPSKDFIHVPCGYGTIFDIDTKYELLKAKLLNKKLNN